MVSPSEARLSARQQLDKLHKGMVVEIDRRLTDQDPEASTALSEHDPEIAEAFELVQQAVSNLKDMRDVNQRNATEINQHLSTIESLRKDNSGLSEEKQALIQDLEAARTKANLLVNENESLEGRIKALEDERASLSSELAKIVQVLKASFEANGLRLQ